MKTKPSGSSRIFGVLLILVACATSDKQARGKAAESGAEAKAAQAQTEGTPVADGDVTVATLKGMRIIVKRISGAELVSAQLNILGGVFNWGKDDAGVEQLALAVSASGGTEQLDKYAFSRRLATLGSNIGAGAGNDFSDFRAKSLKENWDATFALMVDAFLHPALPQQEIELQRQRQLSALRHELEDPDGYLSLIAHQTLFKNHPYENRALGTLETVQKLKREQLRDHLQKLRQTSRLILVVVGDLSPEHVFDQVGEGLGQLPRGDFVPRQVPQVSFNSPNVTAVERKLPTNYILSSFVAPGWREPEFPVGMVAMTVLGWREWVEVRTKRNLSYAPHAGLSASSAIPLGTLYVTAVDPVTTMRVMFAEAEKLKAQAVPQSELEGDVSTFLTGFLTSNEATDGQAALLSRALILGGDWRLMRSLPDRLRAVSQQQVEQFAQKYIRNLQTVVVGDPEKVDKKLFSSL
jgi:predicted Zn-dependent peptidase